MELKTEKDEITIDESDYKKEKDFFKTENEKLKCQLSEMKYKLEKVEKEKTSEYIICLKDDTAIITANVEEGQCAGAILDGLIYYGDVVVSLDSFKYAVPIKNNNE